MPNEQKKIISYEDAISILPDEEYIHTFYNANFGLCGADWSRAEILDKLKNSEVIELTGETARGMGHGMCAYNKDAQYMQDVLFIETDEAKLSELEKRSDKATCKWCYDEFCTNDECPYRADYCPVTEYPEVCKFAEGVTENDTAGSD